MPDLKGFINNTEQIIIKWKNFLINTVFDESKNNQEEFIKSKYNKKIQSKSQRRYSKDRVK